MNQNSHLKLVPNIPPVDRIDEASTEVARSNGAGDSNQFAEASGNVRRSIRSGELRTRLALGAITVGLGAIAANSIFSNNGDSDPAPSPVTTELETVGTTIAIPDESGEGVESLVAEEGVASNVAIDWEATQSLVEKARELNDGEPRLGEPYILPDIPNAEPSAPAAPTPAP